MSENGLMDVAPGKMHHTHVHGYHTMYGYIVWIHLEFRVISSWELSDVECISYGVMDVFFGCPSGISCTTKYLAWIISHVPCRSPTLLGIPRTCGLPFDH